MLNKLIQDIYEKYTTYKNRFHQINSIAIFGAGERIYQFLKDSNIKVSFFSRLCI